MLAFYKFEKRKRRVKVTMYKTYGGFLETYCSCAVFKNEISENMREFVDAAMTFSIKFFFSVVKASVVSELRNLFREKMLKRHNWSMS